MHGMHGDLREEVDGASDDGSGASLMSFWGGKKRGSKLKRSEGVEQGRKIDRGAEGGEGGCFCFPLRLVTRDASGS